MGRIIAAHQCGRDRACENAGSVGHLSGFRRCVKAMKRRSMSRKRGPSVPTPVYSDCGRPSLQRFSNFRYIWSAQKFKISWVHPSEDFEHPIYMLRTRAHTLWLLCSFSDCMMNLKMYNYRDEITSVVMRSDRTPLSSFNTVTVRNGNGIRGQATRE